MDEWFTEGKDESVAVKEFLEIFRDVEKSKKTELLRDFLKYFRVTYNQTRKAAMSFKGGGMHFEDFIISKLKEAVNYISWFKGYENRSVENVGYGVGFL